MPSSRSTPTAVSSRCTSRPRRRSAPTSRPSAANIPSAIYTALFAGGYRTPAIFVEVTGVFTNTTQTDAYRGAGRPEACYVLERLADLAAAKVGLDRAEIRRRNFIPPAAMPYKTPIGPTYDCGDFPKIFARVLELADYAGFAKRRAAAARRGKLRGIGMACYVESSGVAPSRFAGMLGARVGFYEAASIRVGPDGAIRPRSVPTIMARAMPPPLRRSSRRGSALTSRASTSSRATPARCRRAPAPSARARSRSAARRSTAPPRRSSPRAG